MNYTIRTKATNVNTHEVVIDSSFEMSASNYCFEKMDANAQAMRELMPDCQVSMYCSNGDFTCLMSKQDEAEELQWEYMNGEYPEDF